MLHFAFGSAATFNLTLSERATLGTNIYMFVFTRRVPGAVVSVVLSPESTDDRSDAFALDVDSLFVGQKPGQYTYAVYEQPSIGQDYPNEPAIEIGVMHLHKAAPFVFTERQSTTTYTVPA